MKWLKANLWNAVSAALLGILLWPQISIWWENRKHEGQILIPSMLKMQGENSIKIPDNQPAVFLFWATWCTPCHVEMEHFRRAVDRGELPGSRIFAINLGESELVAKEFWAKEKYPFELAFDENEFITKQFNVSITPTVIFLEGDGRVREVSSGISLLGITKAQKLFRH